MAASALTIRRQTGHTGPCESESFVDFVQLSGNHQLSEKIACAAAEDLDPLVVDAQQEALVHCTGPAQEWQVEQRTTHNQTLKP